MAGYTSVKDMFDGGGPGASGSTFSGGGVLSAAANAAGIKPIGSGSSSSGGGGGGGLQLSSSSDSSGGGTKPLAKPAILKSGTGKNATYINTATGQSYAAPSYGAMSWKGFTSTDPANVMRNRMAAAQYAAIAAARPESGDGPDGIMPPSGLVRSPRGEGDENDSVDSGNRMSGEEISRMNAERSKVPTYEEGGYVGRNGEPIRPDDGMYGGMATMTGGMSPQQKYALLAGNRMAFLPGLPGKLFNKFGEGESPRRNTIDIRERYLGFFDALKNKQPSGPARIAIPGLSLFKDRLPSEAPRRAGGGGVPDYATSQANEARSQVPSFEEGGYVGPDGQPIRPTTGSMDLPPALARMLAMPVQSYAEGGMVGPGGVPQRPMESSPMAMNLAQQGGAPVVGVAPPGQQGRPLNFAAIDQQAQQFMQQHPEQVEQIRAQVEQAMATGEVDAQSLNMFVQIATTALQNPEMWPQLRQVLIRQGMLDAEDIGEEYDQGFLIVLYIIGKTMGPGGMPQQGAAPQQGAMPMSAGQAPQMSMETGGALPPKSKNPDGSIPINAHEGEYVIPADVTRRLGTDHFDKLIAKARGADGKGEQ
jgi:hypothetical protein